MTHILLTKDTEKCVISFLIHIGAQAQRGFIRFCVGKPKLNTTFSKPNNFGNIMHVGALNLEPNKGYNDFCVYF